MCQHKNVIGVHVPAQNWLQTIPGEGWFTLPRLYGPLEPILEKKWRWNDFEKVK